MIRRRQKSWVAWQKSRVRQLRDEGCGLDLALKIASVETTTRQRLGRTIGWDAARKAQLLAVPDGESVRFALTGPFEDLSTERRERLLSMKHVSPMFSSDNLAGYRFS